MDIAWFCRVGERQVGPISFDQLRRMAARGDLKLTSLIRRADINSWIEAGQIPELWPRAEALPADQGLPGAASGPTGPVGPGMPTSPGAPRGPGPVPIPRAVPVAGPAVGPAAGPAVGPVGGPGQRPIASPTGSQPMPQAAVPRAVASPMPVPIARGP
ncbi:MAG: GYF domain-containing protein, partial [Planctomycetota bacterium]